MRMMNASGMDKGKSSEAGSTRGIVAEIPPSNAPMINEQDFVHPKASAFLTNMPDLADNVDIKGLMDDIVASLKRKETVKDHEMQIAEAAVKPGSLPPLQ